MSPEDEIKRLSETSAESSNKCEEPSAVKKGKKPFLEPTLSVSLNILDATAFFGGTPALDIGDA